MSIISAYFNLSQTPLNIGYCIWQKIDSLNVLAQVSGQVISNFIETTSAYKLVAATKLICTPDSLAFNLKALCKAYGASELLLDKSTITDYLSMPSTAVYGAIREESLNTQIWQYRAMAKLPEIETPDSFFIQPDLFFSDLSSDSLLDRVQSDHDLDLPLTNAFLIGYQTIYQDAWKARYCKFN
ncbi:MAG: hypothetical protein KME15_27680 [Drouetiella hepatica Uher 2000/2452]|jgi:hypothetical protein|uniref:Uncharacterized protein n=1 Tax=Drouetiella hepatica Uher 2000/2452 TaxID=904376 RepID=A0A951QIL9_9CYAN|nr:hypothetical protein [Drouetiella hepatica Uher 2000/2452]